MDEPGSQILYEGPRTTVIRGRTADGPVIRKRFRGVDGAARSRAEGDLLRRLAGVPGVPRLVETGAGSGSVLTLVDTGHISLDCYLEEHRPAPGWLVPFARDLAQVLAGVHAAGVLHLDVSPGNVLVRPDGTDPVLTDYDLATTYAVDRLDFTPVEEVVGTLPYLSPERSGRTGRPTDARSDLYSLGAVLYQLATGRPPFMGAEGDALALIHAHLALAPLPPLELAPHLPPLLSRIVLRLLEKEPDRRYSSAEGLAHDLARLAAAPDPSTTDFPLGTRDFPARLTAPSRLVGRDREVAVLGEVFAAARTGSGARGVLVSGRAGVGKTALLDELRPMVARAGDGWFVAGKFDQYRQDQVDDAVAQALRALARLLLAEPEERCQAHRARLLAQLGPNAGHLAAAVPEFGRLLEVVPEPAGGDPSEVAVRTFRAFVDAIGAVASRRQPVVIVLDDLQWASAFALRALDALLTAEHLEGVLVVGGYRDDEVDQAHLLAGMIARWHRLGALAAAVGLENLPQADVGTFLAEMLRTGEHETAAAAAAVAQRAGGNPFDTVELVNALRREGGLRLTDQGWRWDERDVRRFVGSASVLDLLDQRVRRLPEPTQDLLRTLACLGGSVEVPLLLRLAVVHPTDPPTDTAADTPTEGPADVSPGPGLGSSNLPADGPWAAALEDGLLALDRSGVGQVAFRHDRIQQAVHASMTAQERSQRQLQLARWLAAAGDAWDGVAAELYLAVSGHLTDPAECRETAARFAAAADRARQVAHHEAAERFLSAGIALLSGPGGAADGDGTLLRALRTGRHLALYALGRFEEADEAYAALHLDDWDPLTAADPDAVQLASLVNRGRLPEAVQLGRRALGRLGVQVPEGDDVGPAVAVGLRRLQDWAAVRGKHPERDRPAPQDPWLTAVGLLINRMVPAVFFTGDPVLVWLVGEAVRLWQEEGPAPELIGPAAHAAFATIVADRDYRTGYTVVSWAVAESRARGYEAPQGQALFLHALSAGPWFDPPASVALAAQEGRELLVRTGDLWNAAFTYFASIYQALAGCETLADAEADADAAVAFSTRTGNELTAQAMLAYRQTVRALLGRTVEPGSLDDEDFDGAAHLAGLGPNATAAANFHICSALLACIHGRPEELTRHAAAAMQLLPFVEATQATLYARLLHGMSLAAHLRAAASSPDRERVLGELDDCIAWLQARAQECPEKFAHLHGLLVAERAAALGDRPAATAAYDRACDLGASVPSPLFRALIVERFGRFQLDGGLPFVGTHLLIRAHGEYLGWGAVAKAGELQKEFPFLSDLAVPPTPVTRASSTVTRASSTVTRASSTVTRHGGITTTVPVDLVATLRAFRILGVETDPGRLQEQVAEVLAMLTGATDVRLVLRDADRGGWWLPGPVGLRPLADAVAEGLLPGSVFRYVERTAEPLVVEDALADGRFGADPYFAGLQRCAVLGVPVLSRGGPRAVLLLENRLTRGAFTASRLDAVQLIAGELGVSLDNALAERFRSLVQRSSELTLVCDRSGTVGYASAACEEMLGTSDAQAVGRHVADLLPGGEGSELARRLAAVAVGRPVSLTVRLGDIGEQPRWAEATLTDLSADPAVGGVMVRLRDITERRQLEIELRHAQKLESVGQLASGIAHEINTPMQFITSNLHFLTDAFASLADAALGQAGPAAQGEVAELLTEIPQALSETVDGAQRVVTIVRAMKAFGHPGGEAKGWTDLNEAVRNTLVVAANEIRPAADVVEELGELPPVWCHLGDVNQVVLNLVINAAHAMAEKVAAESPAAG